ncbi:MAG TPA: carbon-nitrogen hydrolase family protein [Candidatus Didemnitutus sp.]|nr:carbon-nitrogen hydrolase family protein [Candidatus Didemnitutus sp.]
MEYPHPSRNSIGGALPWLIGIVLGLVPLAGSGSTDEVSPPPSTTLPKYERPPRKVTVGTLVGGYVIYSLELEARLRRMDEYLSEMAGRTTRLKPAAALDLAVFPEYFIGHAGDQTSQRAVTMAEVEDALGALARKYHCYLVAPLVLREGGEPGYFSNAALLFDRQGKRTGIYRKVHPVGGHDSRVLEGGIKPGGEFPVFDCDFGRLGIQICFDMVYDDGWRALARRGADVVALPSASPETVHPSVYSLEYQFYVVSATPRDHAAVFNPLGMIEAEVSTEGAVLVDQFDLSFEVLHWDADLEEGAAPRRKFGDKIGSHYYRDQDMGIFWSNDPRRSVASLLGTFGLSPADLELKRLEKVQDGLRGGPVDSR